jgi:hypothetical protein
MNWRLILMILAALGLAVLAVLTWGSAGSALCVYCLIMMGAALLFKRFLINRDNDKFDSE